MPIENTSSILPTKPTNIAKTQQTTNTVASTSDAFATPVSSQTAAKKKKKYDADKALIELSQREDRHF